MHLPDPIVDEVRAARDAIAKKYDYDIERLAKAMRARQGEGGREVVRLSPRPVSPTEGLFEPGFRAESAPG
jgi:hypothetical protein